MKQLLKRTPIYAAYQRWRARRAYRLWLAGGKPAPMPAAAKHTILRRFTEQHGLRILVETGTYRGDTVEAMRGTFRDVHSIELSRDLHAAALRRFDGVANVHLLQGDSGEVLERLVPTLDAPTLYWLDGHFSDGVTAKGPLDTPIMAELRHVLAARVPILVLIDDARLFNGTGDYPTVAAVEEFVRSARPDLSLSVDDDMIRLLPKAG